MSIENRGRVRSLYTVIIRHVFIATAYKSTVISLELAWTQYARNLILESGPGQATENEIRSEIFYLAYPSAL
jgi:hypothetical protein